MAIRVQKRKVPRYTCYSSQPPILNPNRSTVARSTLTKYYSNFCLFFFLLTKICISKRCPYIDQGWMKNIPLYAIVFYLKNDCL